MEYILGPKNRSGCVFCAYAEHETTAFRDDLTLFADELSYVTLNRYPFAAAHLLIIPRRHVAGLADLTPAEHDGLFRLVTASATRLKEAVKADGLNIGINLGASAGAGIAEHLHVHIVPRWPGDTNFMPVLADVRVMPQSLDATWKHLRPFFDDLPGQHPSPLDMVIPDGGPPPASSSSPRPLHLALFLAFWGLAALGLLLEAREVLLPFIMAVVVAYVLTPVVARVERARVPRWAAILITYALTLGSIGVSGQLMIPRLVAEVRQLRREVPGMMDRARREWGPQVEGALQQLGPPPEPVVQDEWDRLPSAIRLVPGPNGSYDVYMARGLDVRTTGEGAFHIDQPDPPHPPSSSPPFMAKAIAQIVKYGQSNTVEILKVGREIVAAVSRGIFVFFLTLMLAGYLMLTRERVYDFFRSLCTAPHRAQFDELWVRIDRGLSGVVRGQLIICLVNGVLSAIGFWLFGLKYWPILAVVAGVMSIIPIFGSILSSVPAVAIGLTQSFGTAAAVLAWIVGIHQLEANFLNPKIIGDAAKIHPVLVVFSLVVGEHLFRLPGALLAVPCLSAAQSLFLHFQHAVYGEQAPPEKPH
jgi:predicted PurR-regulated permease PerM/diadenosine tetraphosphate (Ap4A) HIT family hydrolase